MPPKPSTGENKQHPTDDPGEAPALPALKEGVELSVEGHDGRDGWVKIWTDVRAALDRQGHTCDTRVKPIENLAGSGSRVKRAALVCKCAGKSTSTPRTSDISRRKNTASARVECPFRVRVSWGKDRQPKIGKVHLEHSEECTSEETAAARKGFAPPQAIERNCEADIRQWTAAGLRPLDMYRLVANRISPLKLGKPGRQKVRNMITKMQRKPSAAATGATDIVPPLAKVPRCKAAREKNSLLSLRSVVWSPEEQQILAGQSGAFAGGADRPDVKDSRDGLARRSKVRSLAREKLLAYMAESAEKTASLLADDFDRRPESYARCLGLFERLHRDAVALVGGANTAGDAHALVRIGKQPLLAARKSPGERGSGDCTEGGPPRKKQRETTSSDNAWDR